MAWPRPRLRGDLTSAQSVARLPGRSQYGARWVRSGSRTAGGWVPRASEGQLCAGGEAAVKGEEAGWRGKSPSPSRVSESRSGWWADDSEKLRIFGSEGGLFLKCWCCSPQKRSYYGLTASDFLDSAFETGRKAWGDFVGSTCNSTPSWLACRRLLSAVLKTAVSSGRNPLRAGQYFHFPRLCSETYALCVCWRKGSFFFFFKSVLETQATSRQLVLVS